MFAKIRLNLVVAVLGLCCCPNILSGQIQRHPTGVNVNAQGATSVFITFSNLAGYVPVEAVWCGALTSAAPDVGDRCDPSTVFGALPLRFAQARQSGNDALTDVMSIPPSVARRAYQAAASGQDSRFFYVRRFTDPSGFGPDQYVAVTCRLTGGGARTPFALLDVRLSFAVEDAVLALEVGEEPVPVQAEIAYNGTGRLVGRWEIVSPGDRPPSSFDLLTEGTLPRELRGTQRRYTELQRFNVFLPPTGSAVLPGPDLERFPTESPGLYQVLLRVEASDDKEGDSDLGAIGAGQGVVHSGAVAGFPLPTLRYVVGSEGRVSLAGTRLRLLYPEAGAFLPLAEIPLFTWSQVATSTLYRLEIREPGGSELVLSALLNSSSASYMAPSWLRDRLVGGRLQWRVLALNGSGEEVQATTWRTLRLEL